MNGKAWFVAFKSSCACASGTKEGVRGPETGLGQNRPEILPVLCQKNTSEPEPPAFGNRRG